VTWASLVASCMNAQSLPVNGGTTVLAKFGVRHVADAFAHLLDALWLRLNRSPPFDSASSYNDQLHQDYKRVVF
jgi:hypothetical protein